MVEDLMRVERQPVVRLENRVETYETQQEVWRDLGQGLSRLRDAARAMYGFENPFRARVVTVSDPSVLTASATREAEERLDELTVVQTAGRDRFASASLDRDFRVPEGRYGFQIGDDTETVSFRGGTLNDFAETVNRRADDVVQITVVPDTRDTNVLIVEGQREGKAATLSFLEDGASLMEEIGVTQPARPTRSVELLTGETLRLAPGEERTLPLDGRFSIDEGMVLRFEARVEEIPRDPWTPPPTPPGPDRPPAGSVTIGDVTIQNEALTLDLPELPTPEPPPVVEDNRVLTMTDTAGRRLELPPLSDSATFRTVEIPASQLLAATTGFDLVNRNTDRAVEIRDITLLDPNERGGAVPRAVLDAARDAVVEYRGIEITRESNTIEDLLPGVTLRLNRPSTEAVEVQVEPDREQVKNAVIELVGFYNQVVRDINIYTRTNEDLIDEIEYFDDDEREAMEARLGIFEGDSSLRQLRSTLQTIMMNAYDTGSTSGSRLLAQVGISTNASGVGGGMDASRLRGYIEINESQLDAALATDFEMVGRLFGHDSNNDLVVDRGVAVALESFIGPYVQVGGIVTSRTDSLDTSISRASDQITRYNERLDDYEQQLKNDFGRMEGMMNQLQESSRSLDRLNTSNGDD